MATFERTEVDLASGWIVVGAMQGKTAPFDKFLAAPHSRPEPCRDQFKIVFSEQPGGQLIKFAIADGISSEVHSDMGAQQAVAAAIRELERSGFDGLPDKVEFERVFDGVHQHLLTFAEKWRYPVKSLGTTLIVGVLDLHGSLLACASVGDAFIVADSGQSSQNPWWFPESQNYEPTGATYSITDRSWKKVLSYQRCPFPIETVIAFTDGLQHVMFEVDRSSPDRVTRYPHKKAIGAIRTAVLQTGNVSRTRNLATLLGMRENKKLMEDDRTVVVLQRLDDPDTIQRSPVRDVGTTPELANFDEIIEPSDTPAGNVPSSPPLVAARGISPDELRQSLGLLMASGTQVQHRLNEHIRRFEKRFTVIIVLAVALLASQVATIASWVGLGWGPTIVSSTPGESPVPPAANTNVPGAAKKLGPAPPTQSSSTVQPAQKDDVNSAIMNPAPINTSPGIGISAPPATDKFVVPPPASDATAPQSAPQQDVTPKPPMAANSEPPGTSPKTPNVAPKQE